MGSCYNIKNNINVEKKAKITKIFFYNNVMVIGVESK